MRQQVRVFVPAALCPMRLLYPALWVKGGGYRCNVFGCCDASLLVCPSPMLYISSIGKGEVAAAAAAAVVMRFFDSPHPYALLFFRALG